jgi:hypothetical protein
MPWTRNTTFPSSTSWISLNETYTSGSPARSAESYYSLSSPLG